MNKIFPKIVSSIELTDIIYIPYYVDQRAKLLRQRYIDNFVFIHINKTGGRSIEKALNLAFQHKTALEKIDEIGQHKWDKVYKFTTVRNPWDKVVSHFHYRVETNQTNLRAKPIKFKEWVKLAYGYKDSFYYDSPKMFMPQLDWITDHEGKILVDFICRFENLSQDFGAVCKKIGKNVTLPHINSSKHGNYREYYDDDTIEIIAKWFSKDIDNFGYRF
ncbi:sulfotransferase family 2 domain-containing protein [Gloeothece verrucosa]|uniref:Sulfotransferase family protein n=1 Tax=Gloeothece verrucosa (strain PCC 7822) TaxID=497965 RepID=E0UJZ6_GLOV7|nr:sulfotransferase family 2 domain-containing protein [Gloeothece verrucosa]ADN14632.1 hypothetical protein Cyan7822_2664 [Gloeothece verrucosa PCC 7822]